VNTGHISEILGFSDPPEKDPNKKEKEGKHMRRLVRMSSPG
jgi:hypothetical protein